MNTKQIQKKVYLCGKFDFFYLGESLKLGVLAPTLNAS